jgi:ABC-type phosphate transport system substrate-binding protein
MRRAPLMNCAGAGILGLVLSLGAGAVAAQVVAVISAKSPVATLSKDQVMDIFLGRTSRFPDGSQAVPIDQAEGAAARDEFYANFSGKSPAQLKAHWSKIIFTGRGQPPREVSGSAEVRKIVIENPSFIGYIERSLLDRRVKVLLTQ